MTTVHFKKKSGNSKVGPIPVTTSSADTCPKSCAMYDQCYAKTGPQSWHWNKVTAGERGGSWSLTKQVMARVIHTHITNYILTTWRLSSMQTKMVSPLTPAANHSLKLMMQWTEDYLRYVLLTPTNQNVRRLHHKGAR